MWAEKKEKSNYRGVWHEDADRADSWIDAGTGPTASFMHIINNDTYFIRKDKGKNYRCV